jgi:hypothetical protein
MMSRRKAAPSETRPSPLKHDLPRWQVEFGKFLLRFGEVVALIHRFDIKPTCAQTYHAHRVVSSYYASPPAKGDDALAMLILGGTHSL